MNIKGFYSSLSIKYKILISFWLIISIISLALGYYSFYISKKSITDKISFANMEIVKQINSNINFMQKDIIDTSTYLSIDASVQSVLNKGNEFPQTNQGFLNPGDVFIGNSLKFIINLLTSKSYISLVLLYSNDLNTPPYFIYKDSFSEVNSFSSVQKSDEYKKTISANGKPVWLLLKERNQTFIKNKAKTEIALAKTVKDLNTYNNIGFLMISVDEPTFRSIYSSNLHSDRESVAIVDQDGNVLSFSGPGFYANTIKNQAYIQASEMNKEGYVFDKISGKDMLVAYSRNNTSGWKVYYAVPTDALTKGINSIKAFTLTIIMAFILFSLPIIILISLPLTSPINKLLKSMKKFQKGNFDERVEIKHNDEMGELTNGYNDMVSEIKELIGRAYISQIKEREAELNALQAQINPHFLYNTLDTILMKAEGCKETEIADMIYSLSSLFRLSLNRGKSFALVLKEKELIEHYLRLQKIRYKNKLSYGIYINENILNFTIPKLILQPFVENSIIHGIESRKKDSTVIIKGYKEDNCIKFTVEDNGIGMEQEKLDKLLSPSEDEDASTAQTSNGGYAIKNVNERLMLAYKDHYSLKFTSELGKGTKVEISISDLERFSNLEVLK